MCLAKRSSLLRFNVFNYLGGRPKEIAQSIIFSMYNALFQDQSKALYEEIAEVRGVLQGVHLANRRF